MLSVEGSLVTFGTDRVCLASGTKRKCEDKASRDTLDLATGELKYDEGDDTIAILHCVPAPPGRGF